MCLVIYECILFWVSIIITYNLIKSFTQVNIKRINNILGCKNYDIIDGKKYECERIHF